MKSVKIIRQTKANGQTLHYGEVYPLPEADALTLIRMGKAVPVSLEVEKPVDRETEQFENMSVKELQTYLGKGNYPKSARKPKLIQLCLQKT